MRIDNLQQFVKLRRELVQERDQVSRRLAQINEALGGMPAVSPTSPSPVGTDRAPQARTGAPQAGGGRSLRELVLEVLREGPKTKEDVLAEVQRRGYKFQTNNPLNSLGVILYGRTPKFNRVDGRFSLPGGGGAARATGGGGKRQMSAAARARIAEAQRKRWAARKGGAGQAASAAKKPAGGAKRTISPAARKAIAEAARRRWAAAKAAGKNRL